MNANELRGKIIARGFTVDSFCKYAGFVRSTFDRKMSGVSEFDRNEIERIIIALGLSMDDARNIFFTKMVA